MFLNFALGPYALGFVLLAFLPNWRSLIIGGGVALAFCVWAFADTRHADGNGLAVVMALAMIMFLSLGLFAGFLARVILLCLRPRKLRIGARILILALCFPGVISVAMGVSSFYDGMRKARMAPPSMACASSRHKAILGDVTLNLPIAPVIHVGTGREFAPAYMFSINEHARKFCEEFKSEPAQLTSLHMDLAYFSSKTYASQHSAFCQKPLAYPWWNTICRRKPGERISGYPEKMDVYVIGQYEAGKMLANSVDYIARDHQKLEGLTPKDLGNGIREYDIGGRLYFTRADSPDYVANCYRRKSADGLTLGCSVASRLTDKLGLIYGFWANESQFGEQSKKIDETARSVFNSLRLQ